MFDQVDAGAVGSPQHQCPPQDGAAGSPAVNGAAAIDSGDTAAGASDEVVHGSVLEGAAARVMDEIAVLFGDGAGSGVPVWAGERPLPGEVGFDVAEARAALGVLARVDPRGVDDRGLLAGLKALEAARRVLDAAEVHLAAEAELRNVTLESTGLMTGSWLSREGGLPRRVGAQRVGVADKLRRYLPSVDVALTEGVIGFEHAKVLADAANPRVIERFDAVCPALIAAVPGAVFERWCRDVRRAADLLDDDGPEPSPPRPDRLHVSRVGDAVALRGEYRSADGELLRHAIEARADELFGRYRDDAEATDGELGIPPRAELLAEALAELVREGLARDVCDSRPARTEVQLVLGPDQLADMAERLPESPRSTLPTAMTRGRRGLVLTDPHGAHLCPDRYAHLLCDPTFEALILDSLGVPLDMGRKVRLATREQRRAIARRDGGCVFPGCGAPIAWLDAHHVQHWEHGGHTDLDDLTGVCRRHHRLAHRNGWHVDLAHDGWTIWTTPSGRRFWGQRHGRTRTDPLPPPQPPLPPEPPTDRHPPP